MMVEVIDDRKQKVLQIIVEDYIDSAEPVGSRTVTQKYHLDASPATIRFDMADLEKKGYIKKPHTSAGRIPSDKGYRFFIDNLMHDEEIRNKEAVDIRHELSRMEKADLIDLTAELLARHCGNASIVVSSDKNKEMSVSGLSRMLRQPEFTLNDSTCEIIELIERHEAIVEILEDYLARLSDEDFSVKVGAENIVKPLRQCSVVTLPFSEHGMLSVIGPTRMDYGRTASVLRYFADLLEDIYDEKA